MKILLKLFAALCLVVLTSAISLAAAETVDLGPTKISMDLQSIGPYNVETENPSSLSTSYGGNTFTYQFFPATIKAGNTGNRLLIEVHQTSNPLSLDAPISQLNGTTGLEHIVEISDMIPSSKDIQKQPYYVDGYKGIAMVVNRDKGPIYLAAYSPDAKDGFGKIVVMLGSDFPLDTTKSIFESVKTQLVQENTMGQSNTGQSGLGQGNMGQSNVDQSNTGMANMGQSSMGTSNTGQASTAASGQANTGMSNMGQSGMGQSNMGQNNMGMGMMDMMNMGMNMMQSMMGMGQGGMMM